MASMAAPYGVRGAVAESRHGRSCAPADAVAAVGGAPAPVRLLVLGEFAVRRLRAAARRRVSRRSLARPCGRSGHDVTIIDGAVSGDTSAGGLARLDWVLADGADAAIVELGANDGLRGVDPAEMREEPDRDPGQAGGAAHSGAADRHVCAAQSRAGLRDAFRAVFDRLGQRPGVLYDPFFLEGVAAVPALNQPDGLHPNAEGVRRIVARLLPLVEQLLAEVPAA